jgi:D-3-phosphoglycerate dehydrogenase
MGSAGRRKVLLSQPIHEAGMRILGEKFEVCVSPDISPPTLTSQIQDCHGLLVRSARIPASVIEAAPLLKVIAVHGVGVDRIDVVAATRHGIVVANTPEANALSVAEHVLALMCALAKRLVEYGEATRRGEFEIRNTYRAVDLNGKVLGVIGMGRIGSLVCKKAKAGFDMQLLAYDPFVSPEIIEGAGGRPVESLPELLGKSDVVTLHVPLTPETQGLMGAPQLKAMKPAAFLINTSRGAVIDERALFESLREGRLAGAGLDVFDQEPPDSKNPLFNLPNVVVTPHSASLSAECVVRLATQSAQAVVDTLEGRRPAAVVNPQVFV